MINGFLPKIQGIDFTTDTSYVVASLLYDACVNFCLYVHLHGKYCIINKINYIVYHLITSHLSPNCKYYQISEEMQSSFKMKEKQNLNINTLHLKCYNCHHCHHPKKCFECF